jgi:hypothetical protein
MYPGINSIGAFCEHLYASICSLNISGETEMYTINGLATEQTPAKIEGGEEFSANDISTNANCMPYLTAAHNSHLEIRAGRAVSLIP